MKNGILFWVWIFAGALQAQVSDFESIDFHRADSVTARYQGVNLHNLPLLAHHLTTDLPTEVEQFRAIYTWVCTNISGDHDAFQRNFRKRQRFRNDSLSLALWNKNFSQDVFEKLLKKQETVCTGYAYLVKELATLAGIRCEVIDGYGRTVKANIGTPTAPNHSWNAVYLSGRWYLCDATWSSGYTKLPANIFVADYMDGYFLAAPALFARNHYPLDTAWLLMEQPPTFEDFLHGPIIYKDAFRYQITAVSPATMNVTLGREDTLRLVLNAPPNPNLSDLHLEIHWKGSIWQSSPDFQLTESGEIIIHHRFERHGLFDVHIKIGNAYLATYVVRVEKR